MTIYQGDAGGIYLRSDSQSYDGYLFQLDDSSGYFFYSYTNKPTRILEGRTYSYQPGRTNQLTIIAIGTTFYFYLNHKFIDSATDHTFGEGQIALIASNSQNRTTVDYNNFKVWLLP